MCIEPPRPPRAAVDAPEQLRHHVLRRRAAHERVAVRAVGGDQVVARRAAPARCRRSSPPRRSTGAGSRRSWPARTSRPRAPRSGGSASSSRATRARRPASGRSAHQCSTVLQRAMNSSASSCARSARSCARQLRGRAAAAGPRTGPLRRCRSRRPRCGRRAAGSASSAGAQPAARDDQPVGAVGLHPGHRRCAAGSSIRSRPRSSARSPCEHRARRPRSPGHVRDPGARPRARSRSRAARSTERSSAPLQHRRGVHLAGRRRDQHVVGLLERVPARERLAEGRLRERDRAADRLGVGRDAHRERAVERERARASAAAAGPSSRARRAICSRGDRLARSRQRTALGGAAPRSSRASTGCHSAGPGSTCRTRSAAR